MRRKVAIMLLVSFVLLGIVVLINYSLFGLYKTEEGVFYIGPIATTIPYALVLLSIGLQSIRNKKKVPIHSAFGLVVSWLSVGCYVYKYSQGTAVSLTSSTSAVSMFFTTGFLCVMAMGAYYLTTSIVYILNSLWKRNMSRASKNRTD